MADFKKKMIRVLIRDCHARIHKYRQMIEHNSSTCQSIFTAHELGILKAAILDNVRRHRKLRDDQLSGKFEQISLPKQPYTDGALVHNLSSHRFTQQQLAVLSYDAKFSTRDARPEDFIASFESALQKCEAGEECKNSMRQEVSTLLIQHKRQMTISKGEDRELLKIRKMKDIVTLLADKGRSTVVMDKAGYCTKLGNLLMDKEAYVPSTVSEFKKLVNSINNTIGKLRKAGALTRREALAAKASDTAMARFYGLPKDSQWTVKSAEEFLTRIKHLEVEADEVMVSFDVISLFTSIPPAQTIETIDGFLRKKYDETDQQLKRAHIIELLELCLKTFFTFNGQVYEQKKGTPMGSPLSGLIAEAVLRRLEQQVFSSYPPKFWARYVDDTFVVIKRSDVKAFKALLNSIFPDIQFTMEEEVDNQLPFPGVQVTRLTDGKIRTTVYPLPEHVFEDVQQRINATTEDARLKKRLDLQEKLQSLLRPMNQGNLTTRVVNLSKRSLSPAEITLLSKGIGFNHADATPTDFLAGLESILLASNIPEDMRANIRSCATGILRQKRYQQNLPAEEAQALRSLKSDHSIVVGPADKGGATVIMDKVEYVNKANEIFSDMEAYTLLAEDPTKKQAAAIKKKVNELARLKVISPDDSKLMTLSRCLGTRINEHKLAIRRREPLSLVFAHALEYDHRFNWDDTEVVAMANTKRAREFLEAWYSNAGSINRHIGLDAHYEGLRSRMTAPCPNHASATANAAARIPTDSPPTLPLQHGAPQESRRTRLRRIKRYGDEEFREIVETVKRRRKSQSRPLSTLCGGSEQLQPMQEDRTTSSAESAVLRTNAGASSDVENREIVAVAPGDIYVKRLREWALAFKIAHSPIRALLASSKPIVPQLPADPRTLLGAAYDLKVAPMGSDIIMSKIPTRQLPARQRRSAIDEALYLLEGEGISSPEPQEEANDSFETIPLGDEIPTTVPKENDNEDILLLMCKHMRALSLKIDILMETNRKVLGRQWLLESMIQQQTKTAG
nr:unnamed protein product [Spirometra erinaceieuropaei]